MTKYLKGDIYMIVYEPLYRTMKEKGVTTYTLINKYGVSRSLIDRLKHNKPISTQTLDDLCGFLDCRVEDILEYKKDCRTEV
jgi:putative transcriptional regulator